MLEIYLWGFGVVFLLFLFVCIVERPKNYWFYIGAIFLSAISWLGLIIVIGETTRRITKSK